jgi:arsenical pump membrane protein
VVFVTPVVVSAARRRSIDPTPFLFAALFMANASSLYLPGSNLTNLLVLAKQPTQGPFASGMLAPALAATLVTAAGLALAFRRRLSAARRRAGADPTGGAGRLAGPGAVAALIAAVLMVLMGSPALPVAAVALIAATVAATRHTVGVRQLLAAVSPLVLGGVFALAVALGVLARAWDGPARLLAHAGRPETAVIAAFATVVINNLPSAVLLSAHPLRHPQALLIGLNLGPNLAVTGSLAAFLWFRTAAQLGIAASARQVTRLGIVLAPAAIAAALLVSTG